jgi:hypothetical protein
MDVKYLEEYPAVVYGEFRNDSSGLDDIEVIIGKWKCKRDKLIGCHKIYQFRCNFDG